MEFASTGLLAEVGFEGVAEVGFIAVESFFAEDGTLFCAGADGPGVDVFLSLGVVARASNF